MRLLNTGEDRFVRIVVPTYFMKMKPSFQILLIFNQQHLIMQGIILQLAIFRLQNVYLGWNPYTHSLRLNDSLLRNKNKIRLNDKPRQTAQRSKIEGFHAQGWVDFSGEDLGFGGCAFQRTAQHLAALAKACAKQFIERC